MSRQKLPHEKRLYWGGELSSLLILWLNATRGTARNSRVVKLLELIGKYFTAVTKHAASPEDASPGTLWWEGRIVRGGKRLQVPSQHDDVERAAEAVSTAFLKYVLRPELAYGYGNRLLFDWAPAKRGWRASADRIGGPSPEETHFVFTETHAVARIIELCHEGLIDRVRLCMCGTWFYAKFSHSKFHSVECQQKAYRDSPAWRAHRRDYMKRLRAMHSKRIVPSKK